MSNKPTNDEMNTIDGIELYKPLYEICSLLYYATENNTLECLNYYTDIERDTETSIEHNVFYAEIKNTWNLPLKERYKQHQDLLNRVMSNDVTLIHSKQEKQIDEDLMQLTLF